MKKLSLLFFWIFICFQFLVGRDLESDQELALHHFMEAEFLVSQGNYALAILEFQEALELDPNASTIVLGSTTFFFDLLIFSDLPLKT